MPRGHQSAEILGAEDMPHVKQRLTLFDIFADSEDILSGGNGAEHFDVCRIEFLCPFHHNDGVSARWNHSARYKRRPPEPDPTIPSKKRPIGTSPITAR